MNKIQKIVLSIWFLLSFVGISFSAMFLFAGAWKSGEGGLLIGLLIGFLAIVGIPTFFLYKLWADNK